MLHKRLLRILSVLRQVRRVFLSALSFFLSSRLPSSFHPNLYLSSVLLSLLPLSLSHAVSKQTVLSRSISGCHAVEEKNKIKNTEKKRGSEREEKRARERERDISPRLKDLGNLNRFIQKNDTQQKGQSVTKAA